MNTKRLWLALGWFVVGLKTGWSINQEREPVLVTPKRGLTQ